MRDIGARAWESSARASRRCCSGSNLEPHRADDFGYWTDGILVYIHVVGNEIAIHPSRANYHCVQREILEHEIRWIIEVEVDENSTGDLGQRRSQKTHQALDIQKSNDSRPGSVTAQQANQHDDQLCDMNEQRHGNRVPELIGFFDVTGS